MKELTRRDVQKEVLAAEAALREPDSRAIRLWKRIRIEPQKWTQDTYSSSESFWVVAVMGSQCLCLNSVECGWGWGSFQQWGHIDECHYQNLELHHVVFQRLFGIDNGGHG
jgi:hypothetical protein